MRRGEKKEKKMKRKHDDEDVALHEQHKRNRSRARVKGVRGGWWNAVRGRRCVEIYDDHSIFWSGCWCRHRSDRRPRGSPADANPSIRVGRVRLGFDAVFFSSLFVSFFLLLKLVSFSFLVCGKGFFEYNGIYRVLLGFDEVWYGIPFGLDGFALVWMLFSSLFVSFFLFLKLVPFSFLVCGKVFFKLNGIYLVLLGFLMGFKLEFSRFYWIFLFFFWLFVHLEEDNPEMEWDLPSFTGFGLGLNWSFVRFVGFPRFYLVLLGFDWVWTGFRSVLLDFFVCFYRYMAFTKTWSRLTWFYRV